MKEMVRVTAEKCPVCGEKIIVIVKHNGEYDIRIFAGEKRLPKDYEDFLKGVK